MIVVPQIDVVQVNLCALTVVLMLIVRPHVLDLVVFSVKLDIMSVMEYVFLMGIVAIETNQELTTSRPDEDQP